MDEKPEPIKLFTIEKGIPRPKYVGAMIRTLLRGMDIGDSFVVVESNSTAVYDWARNLGKQLTSQIIRGSNPLLRRYWLAGFIEKPVNFLKDKPEVKQ